MKPVLAMSLVSTGSWACATLMTGRKISLEIFLGMLGPLAATVVTWLVVDWIYRVHPESLTNAMAAGFILKMIFFGGYVALVLSAIGVRPTPFVVSFTAYFIGLYSIEAFYLKSLFSRRSR